MKKYAVAAIRFYQKNLSQLKHKHCPYVPTCSEYTYVAIREWGAVIGVLMGAFRILRCNPLFKGGVDHVPLRGTRKRSREGYTVFYARSPYGKHCAQSGAKGKDR